MTRPGAHPLDPRGLIREAYRIDGIGAEDCRSIFFDWAMGLAPGIDPGEAATALKIAYDAPADHPMTVLLDEAASQASVARRSGGWRGKRRGEGPN
ncbi:MAG: hypothetical protein ACFBWO_00870 [Paracoccaceae bacterium]